jgi:hypothetical protein
MPVPDGKISMDGFKFQMRPEEETFFREAMYTRKGEEMPKDGKLIPIDKYVIGNNLSTALRQLFRDPEYQQMINNPAGGVSPSLVVQPGKTLQQRFAAGGKNLYAPVKEIINYYRELGEKALIENKSLDFHNRYERVTKLKQQKQDQYLESSPLGLGRL